MTCWENIPFFYEKQYGKIKQKVRKNADKFIAITERAKQALLLEGVSKDKIKVINVGVDLDKFQPQKKDTKLMKKIGVSENDFIVLFAGQHETRKGVFDLIYAAKTIISDPKLSNFSIKFLFVGKGSKTQEMTNLANSLKISGSCIFLNNISYNNMSKIHNLANIFVLPSIPVKAWQEQWGMVLTESMACKKPVISTLSGSIPEVIGDAGLLIQPNDSLSLYNSIRRLMLDKQLRTKLGTKARQRVEKRFNSIKISKQLDEVYQELI